MQDGQLYRLKRRLVLAVRSAWPGLVAAALMFGMGSSAFGQNSAPDEAINNPVATFTGLDKITGRIIKFDVFIDETVQFGALQVTPRACYSRPQSVKPQTTAFIEVDEVTLSKEIRRIFTGWMFADSPGLSAIEHSVYDIWLFGCKQSADFGVGNDEDTTGTENDGAETSAPSVSVPVPRPKPTLQSLN